ncbi:MAG: dihydrolipoyl dehydrogenase [Ignavibacteriales bacterium]
MFDVVFLGGGPGGYVGAIHGAQSGLRVALVESTDLGGTCLNRGCIPTKALLACVEVARKARGGAEFGVDVPGGVKIEWGRMMARKDRTVARLRGGVEGLLKANGVVVYKGRGTLEAPVRVAVALADGSRQVVETRNAVIATGSRPARPPVPGMDLQRVMTSDEILSLQTLPGSIVIVGGGVIGIEFASIFSGLGSKVTVIEMLPSIIPPADAEISARLEALLKRDGVTIHTGARVDSLESTADGVRVRVTTGSGGLEVAAESVLVATGRVPNLDGVDAGMLGLRMAGRAIAVDGFQRTNLQGVYAAGDVTGGQQLAHVASAQAILAVDTIAGRKAAPFNPLAVPGCVFCEPEVAWVGLTEAEARKQGRGVKIGRFPFAALGKAVAMGETDGFVKVIADESTGEILGAHVLGPHASDLIHEIAGFMVAEGTVEEIGRTVHAHPTLAEGIAEASRGVFGKPIHSVSH